ncbi:hypothetical protein ACLOJK_015030, partial [Asimina triloba]
MVSDLLFSGGGTGDLNVDNIDQPLGLPSAGAPILSDSFALASSRCAERSPSSVHRAGSSGEGGSTSKSVDAVSGSAAEPVAPIEGRVVKTVVPDSDGGLGDNSSVRTVLERLFLGELFPPLDINIEFVEPFSEL